MSLPLPFEDAAAEVLARRLDLLRMACKPGVVYADLFLENTADAVLRAETRRAGQVVPAFDDGQSHTTGLGIRAFNHDQHQVASVADWAPAQWQHAANALAERFATASGSRPDMHLANTITWSTSVSPDAAHTVARDAQQHVLSGMLEMARAGSDGIHRVRATLQTRWQQTLMINTENQALGQRHAAFGVRLDVWDKANIHSWGQAGYQAGFGALAFEGGAQLVRSVLERSSRRATTRAVSNGTWPVVFAGGWAGLWLHEAVGHLLEADALPTNLSPGDAIGAGGLTVYDDPTIPGLRGSFAYDDEGSLAARTLLVDEGKLVNILNDRFYAGLRHEAATGNGRRMHYNDLPMPRMSNLYLAPGTATQDSLIAELKTGLYVLQASDGRVDPTTGKITLRVDDGYWIENGRFSHPIKDVQLTAPRLQLLQNLVGVAATVQEDHGTGICEKAGQRVAVSVNTPAVCIAGLDVVQL